MGVTKVEVSHGDFAWPNRLFEPIKFLVGGTAIHPSALTALTVPKNRPHRTPEN